MKKKKQIRQVLHQAESAEGRDAAVVEAVLSWVLRGSNEDLELPPREEPQGGEVDD